MSGMGGTTLESKEIAVGEGRAARAVAVFAEALGYRVLADEPGASGADLRVLEATRADALPDLGEEPVLVVAPCRLRPGEAQRMRAAGARRVLDAEACVLEVAFALTDLLFDSRSEQRRYGEAHGRVVMSFTDAHGVAQRGRLTGVAQSGGFIVAEVGPAEGRTHTFEAEIADWRLPVRGRVAFADRARRTGFGLEFALEDRRLAPRLGDLVGPARPRSSPPRPASGLSA